MTSPDFLAHVDLALAHAKQTRELQQAQQTIREMEQGQRELEQQLEDTRRERDERLDQLLAAGLFGGKEQT